MIGNLRIDQAASFAGLVFLSCEPKIDFQTKKQATTKQGGLPKWEAQVLAAMRDQFGNTTNEVLKVGMTGSTNPGDGLAPFRPVQLVDLEVGVMERTKKGPDGTERVVGVTVWFRCSEIVNVGDVPVGKAA